MPIDWTPKEREDLRDTIAQAREQDNEELARYWQGILDGSTPVTDWKPGHRI